jgi:hypothetical protein
MGKLDGKVAAITGGTRSIGRGIADAFIAEGASVVLNGRDPEKGQRAIDEIGDPSRTAFFAGDATEQETNEGIVDFAVERFGQLDIMVLNSGGVLNTAPVAMMSDEEWKLEVDWNLNSVFWGMRRALQHMLPRESGRVLVTSSVEGKLGKPGIPGYTATKQRDPARARRDRHPARRRPRLGRRDGCRHVRQPDRTVHVRIGDQASEHGRRGRGRRGAPGVRRRPQHDRMHVPGRRRNDAVLTCWVTTGSVTAFRQNASPTTRAATPAR